MTVDEYLHAVLDEQSLTQNSEELEALRKRGAEVKDLLRSAFSAYSPSVRNAGSFEKGTMVRASYDLDLLCYFPADTDVGENLQEIYDEVASVLVEEYTISKKRSAIKLLDPTDHEDPVYFHVDVVPGRFIDGPDGDVHLHQRSGEKNYLKTNPEKQIGHVRDSGVRPAIKLAKVWRERSGFSLATFVLELLVIDLLDGREDDALEEQLKHFWSELKEQADSLSVTDPANDNNDLSEILDAGAKAALARAAERALDRVEDEDWKAIFGEVEELDKDEKVEAAKAMGASVSTKIKPWSHGRPLA